MIVNNPETLLKFGFIEDSLEEAVKKYPEKLEYIIMGIGAAHKYAVFNEKEKYLLIVSQQKNRILNSTDGVPYNTQLTITSRSDSLNQRIYNKFEQETGLRFKSEFLNQSTIAHIAMNYAFEVFEKNPEVAMEIFKGKL